MEEQLEHQEQQYLSLIRKVFSDGIERDDRTGIGTLSIFGEDMTFDISKSFPLLTTKRVYFKGVVEELLWMLRGQTCAKILHDKGVKIWDGNSTDPKYIERTGNKLYDIGPGYGFQLRHFGGNYNDITDDSGIDQLRYILQELQDNPESRRIMWSYWNPKQMQQMCLPPCHFCYQFYFNKRDNSLSCLMTQRSADLFLGTPFNIASVSLLVYILCHIFEMKPGNVKISMGDVHLYKTHLNQAMIQNERKPYNFPKLIITKSIKENSTIDEKLKYIEELTLDDIKILDYECHNTIKADMAI